MLTERADEVLHGPRAAIGPPWAKDHRIALADAAIMMPAVLSHRRRNSAPVAR
jgi:hypothetical protein